MNGTMYWMSLVLVVLNLAAFGLWIATLRPRLVLSMSARPARVSRPESGAETTPAPAPDAVEQQLADDIRQWRTSLGAGTAGSGPDGLEHWIAEVEQDERRTGTGRSLPLWWRDLARRVVSRSKKRPWRVIASMARGLTGS